MINKSEIFIFFSLHFLYNISRGEGGESYAYLYLYRIDKLFLISGLYIC